LIELEKLGKLVYNSSKRSHLLSSQKSHKAFKLCDTNEEYFPEMGYQKSRSVSPAFCLCYVFLSIFQKEYQLAKVIQMMIKVS